MLHIRGDASLGTHLKDALVPFLLGIADNLTLTELDVSGHAFGDVGACALARALQVNPTLTALRADHNHIGLLGFSNLALALRHNRTLRQFPLPLNDVMAYTKTHAKQADATDAVAAAICASVALAE